MVTLTDPYLEAGRALAEERRRQGEARGAVAARLTEGGRDGGTTHIGATANEIFLQFPSQVSLDIDIAIYPSHLYLRGNIYRLIIDEEEQN